VKPETEEWLNIAARDLGSAESLLRDGFLENAAYFCQQAVEKLLKGRLTQISAEPPKSHDLVELAELIDLALTEEQRTFLTRLSDHAVRSR